MTPSLPDPQRVTAWAAVKVLFLTSLAVPSRSNTCLMGSCCVPWECQHVLPGHTEKKSAHSFSQSPFLQARPLGFLWLQIWMLALLGSKGCALFSRLKGNGKFLMQKVTQLVELPRGSSLIYRVLGQF